MILATDHSKFGRNAMIRLGNIGQADQLFTDTSPPEEIMAALDEYQVNLHMV